MQRRVLERSGRQVFPVGFGARGMGPAWRGVDPREIQRVLFEALEAGIGMVDVSPEWGDSEALVGEAVRVLRARDHTVVSTLVPVATVTMPHRGQPRLEDRLPADWVRVSVERSLRATRLEVLPLAQLPGVRDDWRQSTAWPELRGTMQRLVSEGKVLSWGAIVDEPGEVDELLEDPVFSTIQVAFSLRDRDAAPLIARAAERKVGVLVRRPLDGGALGGDLGASTRFPPGDERTSRFPPERLDEIATQVARLAPLVGRVPPAATSSDAARAIVEAAQRVKRSGAGSIDNVEVDEVAELALRFVLEQPVAVVLVGMRSGEHVRQNCRVADGRALSARLREALERT